MLSAQDVAKYEITPKSHCKAVGGAASSRISSYIGIFSKSSSKPYPNLTGFRNLSGFPPNY
jgi:hypothetical protein